MNRTRVRRAHAAVAGAALALASGPVWAFQERMDAFGPFFTDSDGAGQSSSTPYSRKVRTDGTLRVVYHAPATHCSALRVRVSADGAPAVFSDPVEPGRDSEPLDFGRQSAGVHAIIVQAEGVPGGCNTGRLLSWGGRLTVWTSGADAGPAESGDSPLGDIVFEVERAADERGCHYRGAYVAADGALRGYGAAAPRTTPLPPAEDGFYGVDWLRTKYGPGDSLMGTADAAALAHARQLARALSARAAQSTPRPPSCHARRQSVTVYVRDPARGAYQRIALAERGERVWSSPPPVDWAEGSAEAAELSSWLLQLMGRARGP